MTEHQAAQLAGMREVTKDEFYATVGTEDVHPQPIEPFPYVSVFKTRHGVKRGATEDYYPEGSGLYATRYWVVT